MNVVNSDNSRMPHNLLGWVRKFRIHPLFVGLLILAVVMGLWKDMCVLFLLVMLHEMGHALTAEHFGYEVERVSLLPFGGVARISYGNIGFQPKHEAAIAIAGPLVNLLMAVLAWGLFAAHLCSFSFFKTMVGINAWIILFNMLPGLPLDGGRVFRSARSRSIGFENATREAYHMAIGLAALLLVLGAVSLWLGSPHVGIVVLGVFLFVSAWSGRRDISMEVVRFLDEKKRVSKPRLTQVKAIATDDQCLVRDVVRQFSPDRYHMVYVFNQSGVVETVLEEDELLEAVFQGKWMNSVEEWIRTE